MQQSGCFIVLRFRLPHLNWEDYILLRLWIKKLRIVFEAASAVLNIVIKLILSQQETKLLLYYILGKSFLSWLILDIGQKYARRCNRIMLLFFYPIPNTFILTKHQQLFTPGYYLNKVEPIDVASKSISETFNPNRRVHLA